MIEEKFLEELEKESKEIGYVCTSTKEESLSEVMIKFNDVNIVMMKNHKDTNKESTYPYYLWSDTPVLQPQIETALKHGVSDLEVTNPISRPAIISKKIDVLIEKGKIPTDFSLIDFCCGDGVVLTMLSRKYPNAKLFGFDILKDSPIHTGDHQHISKNTDVKLYFILLQEFIKSKPNFKFDVSTLLNTYRGWVKPSLFPVGIQQDTERWLRSYSKYTIVTAQKEQQEQLTEKKEFDFERIGQGEGGSDMLMLTKKIRNYKK